MKLERLLGVPDFTRPPYRKAGKRYTSFEEVMSRHDLEDSWLKEHPARGRVISCWWQAKRIGRRWKRPDRRLTDLARFTTGRLRRGWTPADTFSLDDHLAQIIGEMIMHLRDHGHGYPCSHCEEPCTCERDWHDTLTQIAEPLLAYKSHWDWPDGESTDAHREREEKVISEAQDALRKMADVFPSLWD